MGRFGSFSERFQHLIDSKKMSQADVSRALGFTEGMVSNFLSGKTKNPIRKTILKIADYFTCSPDWLATGEGEPFPDTTLQAVDNWLANEDRGFSELSEHENAIAMARIVRKGRETMGVAKKPDKEFSITEMLEDTRIVLESDTVYRQALASNIRAFKQAVVNEEKMKTTDEKIDDLSQKVEALTAIILQNQAGNLEKKQAGNDH